MASSKHTEASERAERRGLNLMSNSRSVLTVAGASFLISCVAILLLDIGWIGRFDVDFFIGALICSFSVAVIAALCSLFMARRQSQSLVTIHDTIQDFSKGDFNVRANIKPPKPLADVGQWLDEMLETIQYNRTVEIDLTNDVVHELRSPLAAIQATLEGMIDGVLPMDEARLLTLNREVIRLGVLVKDQLDLTRLESRHTLISFSEIDLSMMIGDLVTTNQIMAEDVGLELEYLYDPDVLVMGDYQLLNRAVSNLLSNAIRYTPTGGQVTVAVRRDEQSVKIIVADTGIGIAEEHQEKIFSRFWRVDSGRSRETGGLGLGLAMVREIVLQHNGRIDVESAPDEGSIFTIRLPALEKEVQQ